MKIALSNHRINGANNSIRFTIRECSLGLMLAAISEQGVCALALGDNQETLMSGFLHRFPQAESIVARKDS